MKMMRNRLSTLIGLWCVIFAGQAQEVQNNGFKELIEKMASLSELNDGDSILSLSQQAYLLSSDEADSIIVSEKVAQVYYFKKDVQQSQTLAEEIISYELSTDSRDAVRIAVGRAYELLFHLASDQGNLKEALNHSLKSVDVLENSSLTPQDKYALHGKVAGSYRQLGQLSEADSWLEKGYQLIAGLDEKETLPQRLRYYASKSLIAYGRSDLKESLNYNLLIIKTTSEDKEKWARDYIAACINLGNTYLDMGEADLAIDSFNKCLDNLYLIERLPGTAVTRVLAIHGIAAGHYVKEEYTTSIEYFNQELEALSKLVGPKHPQFALIYRLLSANYSGLNQVDRAQKFLTQGWDIYEENFGPNDFDVIRCINDMGTLFFNDNQFEKADKYFDQALERNSTKKVGKLLLYASPQSALLGLKSKIQCLVEIESDESKLIEGFSDLYNKAIHQANYSYIKGGDLNNNVKWLFEEMTNAGIDIYQKTGDESIRRLLLEVSEYDKSRNLLTHINSREAQQLSLTDESIGLEKMLQDSIENYLQNSTAVNSDSSAFLLDLQYQSFIEEMATKNPEYYELKYNFKVPSTEEVQSQIDQNTLIVEYYFSDSSYTVATIGQDEFEITEVPMDSNLVNNINVLRHSLSNPGMAEEKQKFISSASFLYEKLLGPVASKIKNKNLIIVPSGMLYHLPFDVLLTEKVDASKNLDFKDLPYLVKEHSIGYANSVTLLSKLNKAPTFTSRKEVLAFSPSFKSDEPIAALAPDDTVRNGLGPLAWVGKEVDNIDQYYSIRTYREESADEAAFRRNAKDYSIVHIASHALVDDNNPLYSKIALSLNEQDTLNDGYIHMFELLNTELNAEMAVLSACNTGFGKIQQGEGVMSLAQGFFYSGVKSVVMSLWLANDESTAKVMDHFYKHLSDGKTKDESLRQAKLDYLKQSDNLRAHPYYWAQFVATGNMRPIQKSAGLAYYWYAFMALIIVGSIIRYMNRSKTAA